MGTLDRFNDNDLLEIVDSDVAEELKKRGYNYGWYKKQDYVGEIYIFVNPAFKDLVKIGYADNVPKRVKQLNSNSGLPDPYHVYATYKVKKRLEDLRLHSLIESLAPELRHAQNREFYEMTAEKAYSILSAIAQINGDEDCLQLNPLCDDFFTFKKSENEAVMENGTPNNARINNDKPVAIQFLNTSDGVSGFKEFSTWRGFEVEVCRKVVEKYGANKFKEFVLDFNNKQLHTNKKHQFGETAELMVANCPLFSDNSIGIYMNTNNSSDKVLRICELLVEKFPEASYRLIYTKE